MAVIGRPEECSTFQALAASKSATSWKTQQLTGNPLLVKSLYNLRDVMIRFTANPQGLLRGRRSGERSI